MDEFITSLDDVSVGLLGGDAFPAQAAGCQPSPAHSLPHLHVAGGQPRTMLSQGPPPAMGGVGAGGDSATVSLSHGCRKVTAARNKQTNFAAYEDNILCKSWLQISCDPITNIGQKRESFWGRILKRYDSQRGNYLERSQKSLMSRWDFIKAEVSKFSGYVAEMIRTNPSGMSDSDKSVAAAANFDSIEDHNFHLMHCWNILKDEPKWAELKRRIDGPQDNADRDSTPHASNTVDLDPDESSPVSSTGKRPMGRDTTKAAKKKASSTCASGSSSEYVSKMHELSVEKISLFKETEVERKVQHDEIVSLEKMKVDEAREHRRTMVDLEKERLALDKERLAMDRQKREREKDERILAVNLDQCQGYQRMYYQAMQEEIVEKMNARRRQPNQ